MAQSSSMVYFRQLLFLTSFEWARRPFLRGFVTSAGSGSESLIQASRAAITIHAETFPSSEVHRLCSTVVDLLSDSYKQDRVAVPTMEFLVFLIDADILQLLLHEEAR